MTPALRSPERSAASLLARTARLDVRLQVRHGTWAAVLAVAVAWVVLVRLVPAGDRSAVLGLVVYGDVAAIGVVFAGAHVLADRRSGVLAAMGASGMPSAVYVAASVATLTAAGVAATVVVVGGAGRWSAVPLTVVAALGLAAVTLPLAIVVAAHTREVTRYLLAVQVVLLPVALPLLAATGWVSWPVANLVPTSGPLRLLLAATRGTVPTGGDLVALVWTAIAAVGALLAAGVACDTRLLHEPAPRSDRWGAWRRRARRAHRRVDAPRRVRIRRAPRTLLTADARGAVRDPVLLVLLLAPLALALVARVAVPALTSAAWQRLGWDLTPHRPSMLTLVVLVTPMLLGSIAGLLTLEDRETGVEPALMVSPVGRTTLLLSRPLLATTAAALTLTLTVPVTGLADPGVAALGPVIALAASTAAVWALVLPALARDRLGGLAAAKALTIPAFAPLLADAVDGAALAALRLAPTWWTAEAVRAAFGHHDVAPTLAVGLPITAAICAVLLAAAARRLDGA